MASLWKHPKSNFWTACFTDEAGRRRKRSTRKLKRSDAQKIADTWEAAYQRKISRGQAQKVLSELFDEGGQAETTVEKFARGWLEELKPSVSPSTYSVYSNGIKHFLASMGNVPPFRFCTFPAPILPDTRKPSRLAIPSRGISGSSW